MAYIGIPCGFCGAMKVSYSYAPNGYVIYKCDECGEKWKDE
jgi:DNA-directed RNA polymerase subunit M/transcription elongation factor TFIIS